MPTDASSLADTPTDTPGGASGGTTRRTRVGDLEFEHDDRVLEPRPWVAMQAEWGVELLAEAPAGAVLELCAGAGHIGLLTAVGADRDLVAVDAEPAAVEFTRRNAEAAGFGERVHTRLGLLQEAVRDDEVFALVQSDPPWVTTDHVGDHPADPLLAIDGGADGLEVARLCVEAASGHLVPGGSLLVQLGTDEQADRLVAWAEAWREAGRRTGERGMVLQLVEKD